MKRFLLVCLIAGVCYNGLAQEQKLKDIFKLIPDSLMPYLTANNRLDFIDFMDSNMKAVVSNSLGGKSEMTALTDDSLSIRLSDALVVDIQLVKLSEKIDSLQEIVVYSETFLMDSVYYDRSIRYFTPAWQDISNHITSQDIKEKISDKPHLQNILKWNSNKVNKD